MSIRYKKVQNKIKGSKTYLQWYGRSVVLNTVNTEQLADEISHATTMTFADVMGVLIELSNVMKRHLLNSDKVSLYRLGSFRVGIKSSPVVKKDDFDAKRITGYRIVYSPEVTFTPTGTNDKGNRVGFFTKSLIEGATAAELTTEGKKEAADTQATQAPPVTA